ncbi:MAG: SLC13 family permease [Bacteroidota bacterium]
MKRFYQLLVGPMLFILIAFTVPLEPSQSRAIGVAAWMIAWWITQAVPIGITALLPMVLFPSFGIAEMKTVTSSYANPIIYLFFGGFVLGLALEKWNLHKRLALNILRRTGTKPQKIILGFMLATAIMSMWISNTASTMMMLPIGLSISELLKDQFPNPTAKRQFDLCLLLGLAYAANIGGITTLIGTPPNLVLAALASESIDAEIGFSEWLLMALPLTTVLFSVAFLINTRFLFKIERNALVGVRKAVSDQLSSLGNQSSGEKRVQLVFIATALLWIFRSPLSKIEVFSFLSDPLIAVSSAIVLFVLPSGEGGPLLVWEDSKSLPWDILLLFGGGLSLASGLASTGVVDLLGSSLSQIEGVHWFMIILIVVFATIFFTEGMSNVALVSITVPIVFVVAESLGGSALELAIPLTIAASCAFMLPIATPPNAIVFSSNKIKMNEMMRAGFVLNIMATIIISIYAYWVIPLIF